MSENSNWIGFRRFDESEIWQIGQRVQRNILKEKRADYGAEIVSALGRQLSWTHFIRFVHLDDLLKRPLAVSLIAANDW